MITQKLLFIFIGHAKNVSRADSFWFALGRNPCAEFWINPGENHPFNIVILNLIIELRWSNLFNICVMRYWDIDSRISDAFDPFNECDIVYDCMRRTYFEPIVTKAFPNWIWYVLTNATKLFLNVLWIAEVNTTVMAPIVSKVRFLIYLAPKDGQVN